MGSQDDSAPLPLCLGPVSNGEFVPAPATETDAWVARETLAQATSVAAIWSTSAP